MKHIHFVIYRVKSIIIILFFFFFRWFLSIIEISNSQSIWEVQTRRTKDHISIWWLFRRQKVIYIKRGNIRWNLRSVCFVLVILIFEVIKLFYLCLFFIKENKMWELSCRFFFVYLLSFSFSLLRIEFGVIQSSKVDQCLMEWIDGPGSYYFYLKIYFRFYFI
jgi:hypothetical protein